MKSPASQHPLAYLLGLEGVALLRAFAGEHDRDFTQARIREVRELLDRADQFGPGTDIEVMPTARGYDGWAAGYDGEPNGAFPLQDRVLLPILDALEPGLVVDAACGTGRTSRELVRRGHRVVGFDLSPGMLARARTSVPEAGFAQASYTSFPWRTRAPTTSCARWRCRTSRTSGCSSRRRPGCSGRAATWSSPTPAGTSSARRSTRWWSGTSTATSATCPTGGTRPATTSGRRSGTASRSAPARSRGGPT